MNYVNKCLYIIEGSMKKGFEYRKRMVNDLAVDMEITIFDENKEKVVANMGIVNQSPPIYLNGRSYLLDNIVQCNVTPEKLIEFNVEKRIQRRESGAITYEVKAYYVGTINNEDGNGELFEITKSEFLMILKNHMDVFDKEENNPTRAVGYRAIEGKKMMMPGIRKSSLMPLLEEKANEKGIKEAEHIGKEVKKQQEWAVEFYKKQGWYELDPFTRMNFLTEEVGEVARAVRKIEIGRERPDEKDKNKEAAVKELKEEIADVMDNLMVLADKYGLRMDEVMEEHRKKMNERYLN